jgi:hypothetical protein
MCKTFFFLIYAWFLSIRVCVCMQNFLLLHIAQNHNGIWIRETSGKWSDFECISLELEIERLLKTTVVITRGAISCEVIRQIQNSLLCEVIVRKCHRCHVVFKVLQFQSHTLVTKQSTTTFFCGFILSLSLLVRCVCCQPSSTSWAVGMLPLCVSFKLSWNMITSDINSL